MRYLVSSAKDDLLESGLDMWATKDATTELSKLVPLIGNKYFGRFGEGHKFTIVHAYPMLNSIAQRWYKAFMRRMLARCAVRNPWRVVISEFFSKDLFMIFLEVVSRTSFGVACKTTKKQVFIMFTDEARVRHVFCELMGTEIARKEFVKRSARGQRKVEAIIDEEKQFVVTYNIVKEMITFEFFYGLWNQHGWPQHL